MLFRRKKKFEKQRDEFATMLSQMVGITKEEALDYHDQNIGFISQSYKRGLDTFGAICHISEASMEKIYSAHQLNESWRVKDIPDYMLLAALRCAQEMSAAGTREQVDFNFRYWTAVLNLPIDPNESGKTYSDRLHELVAEYNEAGSSD